MDEHGQIIDVKPVTVVEDAVSRVVLWLPPGTPTMKAELLHPSTDKPRRWDKGWRLVEATWRSEALIVIQPDQLRAIKVRWTKDRVFQGWYVNLQSRLRRTRLGFDTRDYQLDIVVAPDRSWRWKDEDELDLAVELGRLTPAQGAAVRVEGRGAIEDIERNEAPYSDGWENWQPSKEFNLPQLTSEWDDLSMYIGPNDPKVWGDDLLS